VLDFYVCERCQRQGVGKDLFTFLLNHLSAVPEFLAYDRPSPKLVAFLAKHHGLVHGITQPNNFMIFRGFFQGNFFIMLACLFLYNATSVMLQAVTDQCRQQTFQSQAAQANTSSRASEHGCTST
jgi:GNAT acetyltransferase, Mec-17